MFDDPSMVGEGFLVTITGISAIGLAILTGMVLRLSRDIRDANRNSHKKEDD